MRLCLGFDGRPCGRLTDASRCEYCEQLRRKADGQRRNASSPYHSPEWRGASAAARRRDGQCKVCGSERELEGHHIVARKHGGPDDVANVVTLCGSCHRAYEGAIRGRRFDLPIVLRVRQAGALVQALHTR